AERSVLFQGIFHGGATKDIVIEAVPGGTKLHPSDMMRCNLKRDTTGVIYQDSIALTGYIKRHIFIGIFRIGATICIPDIGGLSIFDETTEASAQSINGFADLKRKLLANIGC